LYYCHVIETAEMCVHTLPGL